MMTLFYDIGTVYNTSVFQIFDCKRMKFAEIPGKLHSLLMPPDPIVINHIITVEGPDARKTACYDIDVEVVSFYVH